jgi:hypothetical protein
MNWSFCSLHSSLFFNSSLSLLFIPLFLSTSIFFLSLLPSSYCPFSNSASPFVSCHQVLRGTKVCQQSRRTVMASTLYHPDHRSSAQGVQKSNRCVFNEKTLLLIYSCRFQYSYYSNIPEENKIQQGATCHKTRRVACTWTCGYLRTSHTGENRIGKETLNSASINKEKYKEKGRDEHVE